MFVFRSSMPDTPANDDYRLLFVIDGEGEREPTDDDARDFAGLVEDGASPCLEN